VDFLPAAAVGTCLPCGIEPIRSGGGPAERPVRALMMLASLRSDALLTVTATRFLPGCGGSGFDLRLGWTAAVRRAGVNGVVLCSAFLVGATRRGDADVNAGVCGGGGGGVLVGCCFSDDSSSKREEVHPYSSR